MSSTFLRRTRGVVGTMITWAATWGAVGTVAGLALAVFAPWPAAFRPALGDLTTACALAGVRAGASSALAYSLALIAAGRKRRFDQLRLRDVATLGAGAAMVTSFLMSRDVIFVAMCGTLGFGASAGSLVMARKAVPSGARRLELESGD